MESYKDKNKRTRENEAIEVRKSQSHSPPPFFFLYPRPFRCCISVFVSALILELSVAPGGLGRCSVRSLRIYSLFSRCPQTALHMRRNTRVRSHCAAVRPDPDGSRSLFCELPDTWNHLNLSAAPRSIALKN